MYLHVFPNLSAASISTATASATPAGKPSHEDQIINCDMKDFEGQILRRHCGTWLQRRRCLDVLESLDTKLQSIEDRMCKSQLLSEQEQQLYGETDRDLLHQKMKTTVTAMRTLVQNNNIDANAKAYLLAQITQKINKIKSLLPTETAKAEAGSATPPVPPLSSTQLAAAQKKIATLTARRESVEAISPVGLPALTHEKDMMGVWRNVLKVGETKKDSAEMRKHFDDLASGSRRWFETDDELKARVAHLKARCKPRKGKGGKTTGAKKKKKSSGRAPGSGYRSRMQKNYE